jgi:hypothetical protein
MAGVILGIPPSIVQLVQTGLIERAFHDALYPALLYRIEAMAEEWPAHTGVQTIETRPSLLAPAITPLNPGQDPQPQALQYEQWFVNLLRYGSGIDTHMPTSVWSNADQFMRNLQQLGLQAGQTVNRVSRDALFQAYLSGQTLSTASQLTTDTIINVASLNGFTSVVLMGSTVRPVGVSAANPLPISIIVSPTVTVAASVVGYTSLNPADPLNGPGILQLAAQIGTALPVRTPVYSNNAPLVIRSGGGNSIDAISSADIVVMQDFLNAVTVLRANNVQPHEDGFYHAHMAPNVAAQLFADPVYQRLYTALPASESYTNGFPVPQVGIKFFMNTESPAPINTGNQTITVAGQSAQYAQELGSEIVNYTGVQISQTLITGRGCLYERWVNENQYISEAGVTGKVGEFDVTNQGISIQTDRIRLVIASPIDRLQDMVRSTWSISTCFPVPTDLGATTSTALFKRACIVQSAT